MLTRVNIRSSALERAGGGRRLKGSLAIQLGWIEVKDTNEMGAEELLRLPTGREPQ